MSAVIWLVDHWDRIVTIVGLLISVLAHLRALVPMNDRVAVIVDKVVGNYGHAVNATEVFKPNQQ